jgi:hypothetical protein
MEVGIITVDGVPVGKVVLKYDDGIVDNYVPDLDGYVPMGRADRGMGPGPNPGITGPHGLHRHSHSPGRGAGTSAGATYHPSGQLFNERPSRAYPQGSAETDQAIVDAARSHHLDPNYMRAVASIESGMNPSSNANRRTQYKGLYQIGHDEWRRVGNGGNIYSAHENAMGAGRLFDANSQQFRERFGRDPTETEMYMMHQQGLGFYTRGAMTNIAGNPYPGMRGPQTHESFEAGWGREIARRKAAFAARNPPPQAHAQPMTDENAP